MRGLRASISTRRLISRYGDSLFLWIPASRLTFSSIQFNQLWLEPTIPESFPPGLLEALEELLPSLPSGVPDPGSPDISKSGKGAGTDSGTTARLKAQMQADALKPLYSMSAGNGEDDDDDDRPLRMGTGIDSDQKDPDDIVAVWPEETLVRVSNYLQLSVSRFLSGHRLGHQSRLSLPISHLRLGNRWRHAHHVHRFL